MGKVNLSLDMWLRPQGSANEFSELGLEELGLAEVWNYLGLIA